MRVRARRTRGVKLQPHPNDRKCDRSAQPPMTEDLKPASCMRARRRTDKFDCQRAEPPQRTGTPVPKASRWTKPGPSLDQPSLSGAPHDKSTAWCIVLYSPHTELCAAILRPRWRPSAKSHPRHSRVAHLQLREGLGADCQPSRNFDWRRVLQASEAVPPERAIHSCPVQFSSSPERLRSARLHHQG